MYLIASVESTVLRRFNAKFALDKPDNAN